MPNNKAGLPLEIPFELEALKPMPPQMGPPLPQAWGIYWPWYTPPGAELRVSNLAISPSEVQIGYPVQISCLAENIGTEAGTKTIQCLVEGEVMAEQTVTLAPGESQAISFEVTPPTAKTYQVAVNGLTGSFRAIEAPTAEFEYVSPLKLTVTNKVTIEVDIQNVGSVAGSITITGYHRDYATSWQKWSSWGQTGARYLLRTATLAPGEIRTFGFWENLNPSVLPMSQYKIVSKIGELISDILYW